MKRKKVKSVGLKASNLDSHSQALYSLLLKPVVKSTPAWCDGQRDIKNLADCLSSYKDYLNEKVAKMTANHNLDHPVRTVGTHTTVEHREKASSEIDNKYVLLDSKMKELDGQTNFLFFDESKHIEKPFSTNMQRYRFLNEIQLSMPVDIFRFSPGGSILSTIGILRTVENRTEAKKLTDSARFIQLHKEKFLEFHTRAQKSAFKEYDEDDNNSVSFIFMLTSCTCHTKRMGFNVHLSQTKDFKIGI